MTAWTMTMMMALGLMGCGTGAVGDPMEGVTDGGWSEDDGGVDVFDASALFPLPDAEDAGPSHDARDHRDAGEETDAASGRVTLQLERAWWSEDNVLHTALIVLNDTEARIGLDPARFTVVSVAGESTAARPSDLADACRAARFVEPRGRQRCVATFDIDEAPVEVRLRVHDGSLATPVSACSIDASNGLCPRLHGCVDGRCERLCDRTHWDAPCLSDNEVCEAGTCVARCNPGDPQSGCAEGACVDGVCRDACVAIAWPDRACWTCEWSVADTESCPVREECQACYECAGTWRPEGPMRSCECLEQDVCAGCGPEVEAAWTCLLAACPSCSE